MTHQNTKTQSMVRADELCVLSAIVQQFIDIPRATYRQGRPETDGEHTLHLQFMAVSYAAKYHPELDIGKVALYGLVHDFVEVYAKDVNSLIATPDQIAQKILSEERALQRLEQDLGVIWPEFITLVHHYELLEEPEARFVKCFDKCDPSFSHFDNKGEALIKMGVATREQFNENVKTVKARMAHYMDEFPDVLALREELIQRVADVTYHPV